MNNNMMWGRKKDDSCMAFSLIKLERGCEGTESPRIKPEAADFRRAKEGGGLQMKGSVWQKTNKGKEVRDFNEKVRQSWKE